MTEQNLNGDDDAHEDVSRSESVVGQAGVNERTSSTEGEMSPIMYGDLNRRSLLTAGSTVALSLLAGCGGLIGNNGGNNSGGNDGNGSDSGTDTGGVTTSSGPASFSQVTLEGPSNATVGESINLSVSIANTGGQNGTFDGTLTVKQGAQSFNKSVEIADVPPGASETATIGSINFSAADNYTVGFTGYNATHSVSVNPIIRQLGESFTFNNGLKTTVKSVAFQPALFYTEEAGFLQNEEQTALLSAASGKMLAVVRLNLENTGTGSTQFGIGGNNSKPSLRIESGSWYGNLNETPLGAAKNIEGTPLADVQLGAGEQTSGWLLGQLPRQMASGTVGIVHQRDGGKTTPEVRWVAPPESGSSRSLPQFSLDTFEMPTSKEISEKVPYTVAVSNQGDSPGTFRGVLQFNTESSQAKATVKSFSADLKPGNSTTFEGSHDWPYVTTNTYSLPPFGQPKTVEMQPATPNYGATYTTPGNRKITVSEPVVASSVTTSGGPGGGEITPESGQQWVLVKVKIVLPDADASKPPKDSFTLRADGQSFGVATPGTGLYTSYSDPVSGKTYGNIEPTPQQPASGYLIFATPNNIQASDMTVQMKVEGVDFPPYVARWGAGTQ